MKVKQSTVRKTDEYPEGMTWGDLCQAIHEGDGIPNEAKVRIRTNWSSGIKQLIIEDQATE
jgi:hypothetical protein